VTKTERTIDVTIGNVRTLVFDVPWKKRESGRDVRLTGGRTSVSEPTDESKSKHHNDEDFDKRNHDTTGV
jgi:hypothetical protein